jgi:hypothetical protein
MRITNRSRFPSFLISELASWGSEFLDVQPGAVETLRAFDYPRERLFRGSAFRGKRQIIIRVAADTWGYPRAMRYYRGPEFKLRDCYDGLAYVLFHELAHFKDYETADQRGPRSERERRVEGLCKPAFDTFAAKRNELFYRWVFQPDEVLENARPVITLPAAWVKKTAKLLQQGS